jgi:hypothetical protein
MTKRPEPTRYVLNLGLIKIRLVSASRRVCRPCQFSMNTNGGESLLCLEVGEKNPTPITKESAKKRGLNMGQGRSGFSIYRGLPN